MKTIAFLSVWLLKNKKQNQHFWTHCKDGVIKHWGARWLSLRTVRTILDSLPVHLSTCLFIFSAEPKMKWRFSRNAIEAILSSWPRDQHADFHRIKSRHKEFDITEIAESSHDESSRCTFWKRFHALRLARFCRNWNRFHIDFVVYLNISMSKICKCFLPSILCLAVWTVSGFGTETGGA